MNSKLMKYGLGISVFAVGGSIWLEKQIQSNHRNQEYYQNAIVLLQKYEPAQQILGRPIFSGKLNFGNSEEVQIKQTTAKLSIPLKGSKENGILHVLASREPESEAVKWNIDQLDLEVKSTKQRWMFYDAHRFSRGESNTTAENQDTPETVESANVS